MPIHLEGFYEMVRQIKMKISIKLMAVVLLAAIVPLSIAIALSYTSGNTITDMATQTNFEVGQTAMKDSTEALSLEKKAEIQERARSLAGDINEVLTRVQADTAELADFATYLYSHPETLNQYGNPSTYGWGSGGLFGSIEENANSWLAVFPAGIAQQGQTSEALMAEVYLTEFMDIKFKSIASNNPYAVQLYLNTATNLSRGIPFIDGQQTWVDGPQQFSGLEDVTVFDFYYLANESHNPDRQPAWTQLYWDPAGLGWMVSCVAPVYAENELKGVVGIDITLEKMVEDVIHIQIEETGFAFLMSDQGQAIAFPERAGDLLGYQGELEGDAGDDETSPFFLTESSNSDFKTIVADMLAGQHALQVYQTPSDEQSYYVAYQPVTLTDWSVGIVVPEAEVIAPAIATNRKIEEATEATSQRINDKSNDLLITFLVIMGGMLLIIIPASLFFSRTISNPIRILDAGSRKIGEGKLSHRIELHSGDEIEDLANAFNQMAGDLEQKINQIETANEELKKLDVLKSQFLSLASHELRTPLIAIQGYTDLIRYGSAGEINDEQRQMLETVSRNTSRLARIVTDLLDLSRIEEGRMTLSRRCFSVEKLIEEIATEQKPSLDKRKHTLLIDVPSDLPEICADRDRIAQVIINLIGNAIKFTPDAGEIRIAATSENENLHLKIIDNGIGIKAEHLDRIFTRFYEIGDVTRHKTSKNEFMSGGTGLGLSIVEGIVAAHGGRIWAESEYGKGSAFHVLLPLDASQEQTVSSHDPDEDRVYKIAEFQNGLCQTLIQTDERLNILLIDDEDDTVAVTRRLLEDDYDVAGVNSSSQGLKQAIAIKPDLILLDAWMPGISGYQVCRTLKGNANTRDIPVIVFTAATQQEDEEQARSAGADAYITKPFQKDSLVSLIERFRNTN